MNNEGERYRKVTLFVWVFYDSVFCILGFFGGCIRYMCLCPSIPQTFRFIDWKKGSLEVSHQSNSLQHDWVINPIVFVFSSLDVCLLSNKILWGWCLLKPSDHLADPGSIVINSWSNCLDELIQKFGSWSNMIIIHSHQWIPSESEREREGENILLEPSHFGSSQPLWFEIF